MPAPTTPARDTGYQMVHYLRKNIAYTDTGAITVGVIPAGAIVSDVYVVVTTAFNAGTSNVIDVGTSADDDGFATDLALGTIGKIVWDEFATSNDLYVTSDTTIIATPALSGTAASAGAASVVVEFIPNR